MPGHEAPRQVPIRHRTLADHVEEVLLGRIVAGEVDPSSFLREEELARELGVSRTPVREALTRLSSAGFLERLPHRGYRVPAQPFASLLESYPIIAMLELLAGRLAFPRAESGDIDVLRALNHELADAVARGDADEALERNDGFHDFIAGLAGNARLAALLRELRAPLRRLERWFYSSAENGARSVREHEALIRALETGEVNAALAIFEANMALTLRALAEK